MKIKTITVSVSKTIQVERFEPVEVKLEASADLEPGEDFESQSFELYKLVTQRVKKCIDNEVRKYQKEKAND